MLPLLVLVLVLAGCGSAEQPGGRAGSISRAPDTGTSPAVDEMHPGDPPPIVLESAAGRQEAVPGSSCVSYPDPGSDDVVIGSCSIAGRFSPESLSTVRPGDVIHILLEGAEVVRSDGCVDDQHEGECIGTAAVLPLGCKEKAVMTIPLARGPVTTWKVELDSGAYELAVSAYFSAPDGRGGDVSGSLGLLVDETAALEVVPAPEHDCLAE